MTPIEVIHAALLHNGKVLFIAEAYSPDTVIWDPEDPVAATAFRVLDGTTTGLGTNRLACCGHSFLSDGKLLAVGGDAPTRATAWKFNPATERWEPAGTMGFARWYPTCVTLGDDSGRVLVVGGSAYNGGPAIPEMEIYEADTFTRVWGPAGTGDTSADRAFPKLYAGLHLTPNGEIFHTRVGDRSGSPDRTARFAFTALDRGQWTEVTQAASDPDRQTGFSVLMLKQRSTDPDRVLLGGVARRRTRSPWSTFQRRRPRCGSRGPFRMGSRVRWSVPSHCRMARSSSAEAFLPAARPPTEARRCCIARL